MGSRDMELEQKINLVNIVFSTPEDANIREELFENIKELETTVNGNSSNKRQKANEMDKNGYGLITFSITNSAKAILVFKKKNNVTFI